MPDSSRTSTFDDRPTICQLVHSLSVGGAEILAREFALRSTGDFRFVFACLDDCGSLGEDLKASGYPVAVLGRRPGFDVSCIRKLAQFCHQQRVGLIHAHQYGPFLYGELASRIAGQIPVLFTEHGRDYPDFRRPKRVLANRILLRRRDRIVAVGKYVRDALVQNEGLPLNRIDVIYNGIDCKAYATAQSQRLSVRAELGLDDSYLVIVQVARLNHLKDHATALRAMALLVPERPQARLVLVGDGEERPALEKLTVQLNLQENVIFAGMRKDVDRFLGAADVFLLSSISEGIPLTLLEAMAAALPCVATRVGGIPEVVIEGETGLLVEPSDPQGMASKLSMVLNDFDLRRRFGTAGAERVGRAFDAQQMHQAYGKLSSEMLTRPTRNKQPLPVSTPAGRPHNSFRTVDDANTDQPIAISISFVIPALNEERHLPRCLASITALDRPEGIQRVETLVVDNQSGDRTAHIARELGARVISVPPGHVGRTRNVGARETTGDLLAFIDADCELPRDWLEKCIEHFRDPAVIAVGTGMPPPEATATWVESCWHAIAHQKNAPTIERVDWLATFSLIVRRKEFETIQGFDESLVTCEDADLGYRLNELGILLRDNRVETRHYGESKTLREFFRREAWRGRGSLQSLFSHRFDIRESLSVLLPPVFIVCAIIGVLLLIFGKHTVSLTVLGIILVIGAALLPPLALIRKRITPLHPIQFAHCWVLLSVYFCARTVGLFFPMRRLERENSQG